MRQEKDKQIATLQDRIEQLRKGTTPLTDGPEFEDKLTRRLQRQFPDDNISHKGEAGDKGRRSSVKEQLVNISHPAKKSPVGRQVFDMNDLRRRKDIGRP
ncbi:MAG: hypothetical protein ABSB82_05450, partial [Terriglobia bacterium]